MKPTMNRRIDPGILCMHGVTMTNTPKVLYLAQGQLFIKEDGKNAEPIESHFALKAMERDERDRQRNAWKQRGGIWQRMGIEMPFMAQAMMGPQVAQQRRINFGSVTRGEAPGQLLYVLHTGQLSGLFHYDFSNDEERRLLHRNDFEVHDLARHPLKPLLACSASYEDGTVHIVVGDGDGRRLRQVTEGDAMDQAPSWVPCDSQQLVYQSAGIGRNAQGFFTGLGPYRIERLDLDKGDLDTLVEDDGHDHLLPRMLADGTLYFIRRPYNANPRPKLGQLLLDIAAFPWRLLRAIFHYLDFFSMIYSGKPLTSAGGPKREGPDQRYLMLWGRWIDVQQAERRARQKGDAGLVPRDWELVHRRGGGAEEVLAKGVLSYDLCDDGTIVYSDGRRVRHLTPQGDRELFQAAMIEKVVALG